MVKLLIVYEQGGKALSLAGIVNPSMLNTAAHEAVAQKQREAEALSVHDRTLGLVAGEEAARLERTLAALIPGFGQRCAPVM